MVYCRLCRLFWVVTVAIGGSHNLVQVEAAFSAATTTRTNTRRLPFLQMGLYDDPLPPRPPPRPKKDAPKPRDDDDDDEFLGSDSEDNDNLNAQSLRLFSFDERGRERRQLLPNLSRRLDTGVACYFEPTDRLVKNLVDKTSVHPEDACWALEACKGDITEAWTCISTARRMLLDESRIDEDTPNVDWLELEVEEEFQELKEKRIQEERKREVQDFFKGGEADQEWLPRNPKGPVDDEPWFTG